MPVPPEFVENIKRTTDLPALIRSRGIDLASRGKDLVGLCPFHEDKEPSLVVTPSKNLWHCFSCGSGGDPIEFVMKFDHVEFPRAVEILSSQLPEISAPSDRKEGEALSFTNPAHTNERQATGLPSVGKAREIENKDSSAILSVTKENHELIESILDHYHRSLKSAPEALRYLESRGIASQEAFTKFRIGYCNETLSRMLPKDQTKKTAIMKNFLRSTGILREKHHEHFVGCVTFPIFDENRSLSEMYGRSINSRPRSKHLYLPGPHRGIWNREGFNAPELILCESIIDALTFYVSGFRNVTASYGVEGFTDEMLSLMREKKNAGILKKVYIAYDHDSAGDRAALSLSKKLSAEGMETLRIRFPLGMDANEFALKNVPASESLAELIQSARGVQEENETPAVFLEEIPKKTEASRIKSEFEVVGEEVRFSFSERTYRVRGLFKNGTDHILKINLRVSRGDVYHLDTFDLLSAKSRQSFIEQAHREVSVSEEILKYDLGRILDRLEEIQEKKIRNSRKEKTREMEIPPERRERAIAYLKDPHLVQNIVMDFEKCGLVGERVNSLIGYLGTVSRKTDTPLAIIIQSSSSAGKSALMDAILGFSPEEDRIKYSFMTGQTLYYMQSKDLSHRILAISEEEGMERAKYAIKLLQSEGKISISTTVKDADTGMPDAREFTLEGPVMIFITSTNAEIDEELQNRSLVLTVNEGRQQTRLIQQIQRERRTLAGLSGRRRNAQLVEIHADAQRLLRTLSVVIPFQNEIDFPDTRIRMRRDHEKFLTLIETIALLFQHQRRIEATPEGLEYIVATREDVALATFLAGEVFGISLDELAPQTRGLLKLADEFVSKESERLSIERKLFRFTRRSLREHTGLSDTRVRIHLERLVQLEYVLAYGSGQGRLVEYELLYDGTNQDGGPFVPGLVRGKYEITPELRDFFTNFACLSASFACLNPNFAGENGNFAPRSPALRPGIAPPSPPARNAESLRESPDLEGVADFSHFRTKTHI